MASLSITLGEVKAQLGMILGVPRAPAQWGTTLAADIDRIIRSGRRRFFSANPGGWNFLRQHITILTAAPQTTGTVTVVNGVVTLAGSTFPTTAATNYLIAIEGIEGLCKIATYTNSTNVTLEDTSVNADALSTYVLYKFRFDMPSNFGGFRGPVTVARDTIMEQAAILPEYEIRAIQSHTTVQTGRPRLFTVSNRVADEDVGIPTWYFEGYPLADAVYEIEGDIILSAGDALDVDADDEICHPAFAEAMAEAIYAAGETAMQILDGVHTRRYNEMVAEALERDRRMKGVRRLLPRTNDRYRRGYEYRTADITWDEE